ncbi:hypothetical protein DB347_15625 [Opitutaceae bacterium EW11]|nr:hypothetical protein DB347_15625 [Opitutaceae bacterium EW11]
MNTPEYPAEQSARVPPSTWPDAVTQEWLRMHRMIEELTRIQRRLGTPLEEPEDFLRIREMGTEIREKLDELRPWVDEPIEIHDEEPVA